MKNHMPSAEQLKLDWANNPRWAGVTRTYSAEDVVRLRGTVAIEHSLARLGAEKLWKSLHNEPFVNALGALTGNQAMQQVKAGLKAIYLSGWQVAADANVAGEMYPDQSLYPVNSVPQVVKRINNTLLRADQLHHAEGDNSIDFLQPIVADAEAGFGGVLNAYELMKAMIEAGAAGVHFEDQLASEKKCGHLGGKVLIPTLGVGRAQEVMLVLENAYRKGLLEQDSKIYIDGMTKEASAIHTAYPEFLNNLIRKLIFYKD